MLTSLKLGDAESAVVVETGIAVSVSLDKSSDDDDKDEDSTDVGRSDPGVVLQERKPKCSRSSRSRRKIFAQYLQTMRK